jgi:hypothetical protein
MTKPKIKHKKTVHALVPMKTVDLKQYLTRLQEPGKLSAASIKIALYLLNETNYNSKTSSASRAVIGKYLGSNPITTRKHFRPLVLNKFIHLTRDKKNFPTISINVTGK